MKYRDIPQISPYGKYQVNVSWHYLEKQIADAKRDYNLNLDPDFQREHVWTEEQQIRFCEWILRGGKTGRHLLFNCKNWNRGTPYDYELVDGKQRINAVLRYLHNEIPVFGNNFCKDFTDNMRLTGPDFIWCINDLATREEVLQCYLDFNGAGTPHTQAELNRVRALLKKKK